MHIYIIAQQWAHLTSVKGDTSHFRGIFSPCISPECKLYALSSAREPLRNCWDTRFTPSSSCTAGFLASFDPSESQLCYSPHFISPWEPWRVESAFQTMCIAETLLTGKNYCSLGYWNSMFSL